MEDYDGGVWLDNELKYLKEALEDRYEDESVRANDLNDLTIDIHREIWQFCPLNKRVKEEVIPLFQKSVEAIKQTPKKSKYSEHLEHWAQAISLRIKNLERYYQGLPSDFISQKENGRLEKLVKQSS